MKRQRFEALFESSLERLGQKLDRNLLTNEEIELEVVKLAQRLQRSSPRRPVKDTELNKAAKRRLEALRRK